MLTKLEKRVLKICNTKLNPYGLILSSDIQPYFPGVHPVDLCSCCKCLSDNKYLETFRKYTDGGFGMTLNHLGRHYREVSWIKVKKFLFRSVFVPIVVSVITTFATLIIKALL